MTEGNATSFFSLFFPDLLIVIIGHSIILEADPTSVVQRVATKPDDLPLGEQTVAQVFQSAREQLKWSLLR